MYGVSKSALSRHVLGGGYKPGRPTALSDQEEKLIVKLLLTCSDMGFCLTCEQTLDVVESYLNLGKVIYSKIHVHLKTGTMISSNAMMN